MVIRGSSQRIRVGGKQSSKRSFENRNFLNDSEIELPYLQRASRLFQEAFQVFQVSLGLPTQVSDEYQEENIRFEDALEYTEYGEFNYLMTLICGMCFFTSVNECYVCGFILPSVACEMHLTNYQKGLFTSVNFYGIIFSCPVWGYVSSIMGRKPIIITCLLVSFLANFFAAFAPTFYEIVALRLVNGIFASGLTALPLVYYGEFALQEERSKEIAYACLFSASALTFLPTLGWIVETAKLNILVFGFNFHDWRQFMFITSIPALLPAIALIWFPESPKFLYFNNQEDEALNVLKKMYNINTGKSESSFPVKRLDNKLEKAEWFGEGQTGLKSQFAPLFKYPYLQYMVIGCVIQAILFAVSSGLYMWYTGIMNQFAQCCHTNGTMTVCHALQAPHVTNKACTVDVSTYKYGLFIGIAYMITYLAWGFLVSTLGNRIFFIICMVISAISCLLLALASNQLIVTVLFILTIVPPGTCVAIVCTIFVDTFPTHMCPMAVCVILTCGRIGTLISSTVIGMMLEAYCLLAFLLYSLSLIVSLVLLLLYPETPPTQ